MKNGSKPPHPIESPPGSLASFPQATPAPGFVHDKVKLRATYFLGCFNSFAAHPFSPLSGDHATCRSGCFLVGTGRALQRRQQQPKPRKTEAQREEGVWPPESGLLWLSFSLCHPTWGEQKGHSSEISSVQPVWRGPCFLPVWACSRLSGCTSSKARVWLSSDCLSPVPSPVPPCPLP